MLLLSVDYFYSVTLRRGRSGLNITMTLSVPKSVWRYSLSTVFVSIVCVTYFLKTRRKICNSFEALSLFAR